MKKPLDRITEAYNSQLGDAFARKVRNRIHWICEQATGNHILDVGCSQGITAILLGREGKDVLAIDLLSEAVQYAKEQLDGEETYTKEHVTFEHANFISKDFGDQQFDAIIFGEVLEHITDPKRFLQKALHHLADDGKIVVTLPFGINDYFDHKKTYYLLDLLGLQTNELQIVELEFFGKWIGAVFEKNVSEERRIPFNQPLVKKLEQEFMGIERELIEKNQGLAKRYDRLLKERNELHTSIETYVAENQQLSNDLQQSTENEQQYHEKWSSLKEEYDQLRREYEAYQTQTTNETRELTTQIDTYKQEVDTYKQEAETYTQEIETYKQEIETYKQEAREYEPKLEELSEKYDQLLGNYQQVESEKEEIQSALEHKTRLLETEQEKSAQLQDEMTKLKQQLSSAQQTEQYHAQIEELVRQLKIEKKEKIKAKEQLIAAYEKEERLLKTHNNYQNKTDKEITTLNAKITTLNKEITGFKARLSVAIKEKIQVREQLLDAYSKEERLLRTYGSLLRKYTNLSHSKLGKLQLSYWRKKSAKSKKAKRGN